MITTLFRACPAKWIKRETGYSLISYTEREEYQEILNLQATISWLRMEINGAVSCQLVDKWVNSPINWSGRSRLRDMMHT